MQTVFSVEEEFAPEAKMTRLGKLNLQEMLRCTICTFQELQTSNQRGRSEPATFAASQGAPCLQYTLQFSHRTVLAAIDLFKPWYLDAKLKLKCITIYKPIYIPGLVKGPNIRTTFLYSIQLLQTSYRYMRSISVFQETFLFMKLKNCQWQYKGYGTRDYNSWQLHAPPRPF